MSEETTQAVELLTAAVSDTVELLSKHKGHVNAQVATNTETCRDLASRLAAVEGRVDGQQKVLMDVDGTVRCLVDVVKSGDDPGPGQTPADEVVQNGSGLLFGLRDEWLRFRAGKIHPDSMGMVIGGILDAAAIEYDFS